MQYARKVVLKQALGYATTLTGWPLIQRRLARGRTLVLTYHGVARNAEDNYANRQSVDAAAFDTQLAWLSRRFQFLRLSELVNALEGRTSLPERGVVITFDDGLRNVLGTALPLLRKYQAPATVFVCSDLIGRGPLWTDEVNLLIMSAPDQTLASPLADGRTYRLRSTAARERSAKAITGGMKRLAPDARVEALCRLRASCRPDGGDVTVLSECHDVLSWDDVRVLADKGIEIGSHGRTHTILTAMRGEAARDEIVRSKETIERELQRPCSFFSYPNGTKRDFGREHQQMLIEAGYRAAVTQVLGLNGLRSSTMALRRVNVGRVSTLAYFQAKIGRAGF